MFCLIKGYEDYGIGKLIHAEALNHVVEYFDTPVQNGRKMLQVHQTDGILDRHD